MEVNHILNIIFADNVLTLETTIINYNKIVEQKYKIIINDKNLKLL